MSSGHSSTAHEICGPRATIIEGLGKEYGETVRFEAVTNVGEYLEMLLYDKTGTYTLIATRPGGNTCIVGVGLGYFKKISIWVHTSIIKCNHQSQSSPHARATVLFFSVAAR